MTNACGIFRPERRRSEACRAELRDFFAGKVARLHDPGRVIAMEAFPLTPNGKIDRRALPAPNWSGQTRASQYVAPRTAEEQSMARIWAEVLRFGESGRERQPV